MRRPPVTVVVVPPSEGWVLGDTALEALRPTLGVHDEVLVVGDVARLLRRHPWARPLPGEAVDIAAVAGLLRAAPAHDLVALVDGAVLVADRWLDALAAALGDPAVVAAVPETGRGTVSAGGSGPGYADGHLAGLRAHARAGRRTSARPLGDADLAGAVCLLARRDALLALPPAGPGDGPVFGGLRGIGRVVAAPGAYVHACTERSGADWLAARPGRGTVPARPSAGGEVLVSACMIVRDEEGALARCLASVRPFVDEVVVYDTGSTDRTVEVARELGAVVVEGHWDDDFGRARNAAREACRGRWLLHVDADEELVGDPAAVRAALRAPGTPDALLVVVENLGAHGSAGARHKAVRAFRRDRARWEGRLHEQVVGLPGGPAPSTGDLDGVVVRHHGYRAEVVLARGKGERNVRIAEAELAAAGPAARPLLLLNLGRSLVFAGRFDDALARVEEARATATGPVLRSALRSGADLLLNLGRPAEALPWVEELRAVGGDPAVCDYLEGSARLFLGQDAGGLLDLGEDVLWGDDATSVSESQLRHRRALALAAAGRWEEAADALARLAADAADRPIWGTLAEACRRTGRDPGAALAQLPDTALRPVLAQLLAADAESADLLGEGLWARFPADARLVGFAVHHGPRVDVGRGLEWAGRVRAAGLAERCPLLTRARALDVAPAARARAAAVGAVAFGDDRHRRALEAVAPLVPEADLLATLLDLGELAPALLPAFVMAAAATPARCLALADALDALGADEQAGALRAHAAAG